MSATNIDFRNRLYRTNTLTLTLSPMYTYILAMERHCFFDFRRFSTFSDKCTEHIVWSLLFAYASYHFEMSAGLVVIRLLLWFNVRGCVRRLDATAVCAFASYAALRFVGLPSFQFHIQFYATGSQTSLFFGTFCAHRLFFTFQFFCSCFISSVFCSSSFIWINQCWSILNWQQHDEVNKFNSINRK